MEILWSSDTQRDFSKKMWLKYCWDIKYKVHFSCFKGAFLKQTYNNYTFSNLS